MDAGVTGCATFLEVDDLVETVVDSLGRQLGKRAWEVDWGGLVLQAETEVVATVWLLPITTQSVVQVQRNLVIVPHVVLGADSAGWGRDDRCKTGCDLDSEGNTLLYVLIPVKHTAEEHFISLDGVASVRLHHKFVIKIQDDKVGILAGSLVVVEDAELHGTTKFRAILAIRVDVELGSPRPASTDLSGK